DEKPHQVEEGHVEARDDSDHRALQMRGPVGGHAALVGVVIVGQRCVALARLLLALGALARLPFTPQRTGQVVGFRDCGKIWLGHALRPPRKPRAGPPTTAAAGKHPICCAGETFCSSVLGYCYFAPAIWRGRRGWTTCGGWCARFQTTQ